MFWEWPNPDLYLKVWTRCGNKNWISTLWPSPLFLFLSSSISWWRPPSILECWSCSQAKLRSSFRILQHSENWILWRARDFFFLGGGPAAMAKLQLQNSAKHRKLDYTMAYSGFFFFSGGSSFRIMKILQTHKCMFLMEYYRGRRIFQGEIHVKVVCPKCLPSRETVKKFSVQSSQIETGWRPYISISIMTRLSFRHSRHLA